MPQAGRSLLPTHGDGGDNTPAHKTAATVFYFAAGMVQLQQPGISDIPNLGHGCTSPCLLSWSSHMCLLMSAWQDAGQ